MKTHRICWVLFFVAQAMMGWEIFFEYAHTMSALGKDNLFRLGGVTPYWQDLALGGYGEYSVFFGIPQTTPQGSTKPFTYSAVGFDVMYRKTLLEDIQPYGRFGFVWIWPNPEITTALQETAIRAGIGMSFFLREEVGLSAGVDFVGFLGQSRADRIVKSPVYHQGIQLTGGVSLRF
ncbi:hypothetical protein [Thermospira aquatica]|uniref:Outer membrane protein beta-barrel domain-containing protein n=1 Tax=Thermospira aquatica TaxID=2828656 RepID=A0AAX3BFH8_9SPIR|nr:hypothetical protein [Thermospira aquatica]URA11098.1 hypothetical protein KDW03_04690 [Thermospira aquatica]